MSQNTETTVVDNSLEQQSKMTEPAEKISDAVSESPVIEQVTTSASSDVSWLQNLIETLNAGGPVVMLLILMSIIALTIVILKLIQFRRAQLWKKSTVQKVLTLWQHGKVEHALALADKNPNPTTQALARAIRGKQQQLPDAVIREEVLRYGSDALFHLRKGFRPLEVIGSLAPLLGLLGTVMGMIKAFQQLEAAGNKVNPAILSGGIWEALLTTAVGLCVAIPVVALLNWLERHVDHQAHQMDNVVTKIFTQDLSAASKK